MQVLSIGTITEILWALPRQNWRKCTIRNSPLSFKTILLPPQTLILLVLMESTQVSQPGVICYSQIIVFWWWPIPPKLVWYHAIFFKNLGMQAQGWTNQKKKSLTTLLYLSKEAHADARGSHKCQSSSQGSTGRNGMWCAFITHIWWAKCGLKIQHTITPTPRIATI